ncbi:MAG: hypothetical protein Q9165_006509 [Trypethelium subeluteriae]
MFTLLLTTTPLAGPVASLKVQRTVPGSSDIFKVAMVGDVDGIRRLFENGLASPHDVQFESGVTPLHVAANYRNVHVCKLLLQANADPFQPDYTHCTAADNAWTKILSKCMNLTEQKTFRSLFSETECVERRQLTVLHKIVLGLISKDLELELASSTADIDAQDSIGRTPLSMAGEQGDVGALATLLRYGADPNILSFSYTSPLHYAATAKYPDGVRLLLEVKGIEVDGLTDWRQTPLHLAAAYTKDVRHTELLLDAGANVNQRDRDGIMPLGWTAISNNPLVADLLLKRGAVIENVDLFGFSALHQCIAFNRHDILALLVPFEPAVRACIAPSLNLLHLIASNADIRTMRILRGLDFTGIAIGSSTSIGEYLSEVLAKRSDYSPEMQVSFEEVIDTIKSSDPSEPSEETWADAVEHL